ncbi:alpha/beta hydrolase [Arsenicicoccus sp. oral taxon 190]|uniref:alpha/beta hydrolase n=1 Tax=Arsenicicoccus sp. oral taxon 190 TaxID=1658671 RepID=UPI0012E254FF|nr:alpha/beta hydrolase-fold protein [Arsenicicoccus sp. oral taxon 190]
MVSVLAIVAGAVVGGMTRRTLGGLLVRLLVQLLVVLLSVIGVAAVLNAQNQWYVDWGDLTGTNNHAAHASTTGGSAASALGGATAPATPTTKRPPLPPLPNPGERVQTFTVKGAASGLTGRIVVLLPDRYSDPAQATRDYPVLVTTHGYPGNPEQWLDAMQGAQRVDAAAGRGKVAPLLLVSPQLDFPKGADSECVDAPGGAKVETWLAKDVPEFVRTHLRARTDRASWSAAGFSTGGYCAALATVKHPDTYGSGIVLGGYGRPAFGGPSPLRTPQQKAAYDLPAIMRASKPPVALWVQSSDSDEVSYRSSKELGAAAAAPTSVTMVMANGTVHRTAVWSAYFAQALEWLGTTVPGFSPAAASAAPTAPASTPAAAPSTPAGALAALPGGAPRSTPPGFQQLPVSHGRLLKTTLAGKASGVIMPVWVWLPPAYDDPAQANTRFPVAMLFPGGDGADYTQWYDFGQPKLIAEGAAAGRISPFVMVMPALQVSKKLDTECTDLPGQPKVETFFTQDVVAMATGTFRVLPQRTAWAVGGASSGAYCASRLGFAHPDRFSTVASLSGYFVIDSNVPAGRTPAARATSPKVIAAGSNPPAVTLRNWVGDNAEEQYSTQLYNAFAAGVRPPTDVSLARGHGGHDWKSFRTWLPDVFTWLTGRLDRPSAG